MPTLISRSKTDERISKGNKNASNQGGTSTLSSPTAQLFSDDFFDEENKQDKVSLAIKSKSSFGNADVPKNNSSGVKQLKSSPSFPAIQLKSVNQPVQRVANTSQPAQLNSWWSENAPSWLGGSDKDEKLDAIGGGLKTTAKGMGAGLGGAVGAGLGAVGGGIAGAGLGAYQGATGAYSEAKKSAGGGIMGTIAGLGAGLMGGIGGLFSGGAAGAVGGAAYGGLAGGKLGSGDAEGAGSTFGDFIDGGLKAGGHINDGAKGFGKGAGNVATAIGGGLKTTAKGVATGLGGAVGAGLGAVGGGIVGAGMGAFQGATGAYDEAKKSAGGGIRGTIAGLGAGLMGGIGGLVSGGAAGALGGAAYGGLAGGKLGSGNAKGAEKTLGKFKKRGLSAAGRIHKGGKAFSKGAGKVAKGIGTLGGGIIGAGLGGVVGTFAGAGVGASTAYENANKKAGGGILGGIAGASAGLLGGIAGAGAGAVGGAALGAHELGKAAFNSDPSKPKEEGNGEMSAVEKYLRKNRISTASQVASVGINTAKYAEQGLKTSDFARETMAAAAGTVTTAAKISGIGGAALGGITAIKGGVDWFRGSRKIKRNNEKLDGKERGKDLATMKERVKLRQKIEEGKDMKRGGKYGVASGLLSTAAGVATATGIGAPIGLGLGLASMAVSGAGAIHGAAIQSGRDKEARRMRSKDEIIADKIQNNQAREERIGGSIFNPMNWKAKFERSTGLGDTADKRLGTLSGRGKEEDNEQLAKYADAKRTKYQGEGYDYKDFDGKETDDLDRKITKTSMYSKFNPKSWGKNAPQGEKKSFDAEDIMFNKSMHSKEINKRTDEDIKGREKWWHWGSKKSEKKEEGFGVKGEHQSI